MARQWKKASKFMGRHLDLDGKTVRDDEILEGDQWATYSEFLEEVVAAPAKAATAPAKPATKPAEAPKPTDVTQPSLESAVIAADERKRIVEDEKPATRSSKKKPR